MSIRKFELTCGLSLGYINNIRVSIQPDKVTRIADNFPDLSTGWLLTGEGEMLKKEEGETDENPQSDNEMIKFLVDQNKKFHKYIDDQSEIIKNMQKTIDKLQSQVDEKGEASVAPEAGAECAAVG